MTENVTRFHAECITKEINEAIADIFTKYGLERRPTKTGFGEFYTIKIEAVRVQHGRNGVNVTSKEAIMWKAMCSYIGLDEADLGAKFKVRGEEYTLLGGRNAAKFPVVALKTSTGKTVGLPESADVVAAIKAARS